MRVIMLIWKITPNIVPRGFKFVEIVAYIAAGMFNEDTKSLLYSMSALGLSLGTTTHAYVDKEDAFHVMISDARKKNGSTTAPAVLIRTVFLKLWDASPYWV
ncbi:hypothetical protein TNIN_3421 [Trichonephila inaurata madagascariensis]|uniref:Uncharacterized protein n=1 Tax=Trichonephila inaurata madagascariensis TaxID=2747483 RepID=A0A8X6YRG0_9ARAC|nr:hypothetical protein TNIN_3421 [Trichonephila inaurata madagascariensis]